MPNQGLKRNRLDFAIFPLLILGSYSSSFALPQERVLEERSVEMDGRVFSYRVFVPKSWSPDRTWPVILFLHGAGERGSDNVSQTRVGLPRWLTQQPDFPAVVVMPQCPRGTWWGDEAVEAKVFAALTDAMSKYRGDPRRVYLTGLSLGGYGTWAFGYKYPGRFAALVPVCGGVSQRSRIPPPDWHPSRSKGDVFLRTAEKIKGTPVWVFHGALDRTIPVTESRRLVSALESLGADVRYTEYASVGHNSWDRAYSEQRLWEWLFKQQLPQPGRD